MSLAQLAQYALGALPKVPENTPALHSGTRTAMAIGDCSLKYLPTTHEIDSFREFLDEVSIRLSQHQIESQGDQAGNLREAS